LGGRRHLRLATRGSELARRQYDEVVELLARLHSELTVEPVVVRTTGDRLHDVPLDRIGGQGVFVREVQQAVLRGEAHAAVHSAKDLPPTSPEGLRLASVPPRRDPRDVLVGARLTDLPAGARVATGSTRRRAQLANLRPDLTFAELRGNMGTRLRRVQDGVVDVVVTAAAALERLGLRTDATEVLSPSVLLPQVGQGALAIESREDDEATVALLDGIDDVATHRALTAERAALSALGAGCEAPCGALAEAPPDGRVVVRAMLASTDGRVVVRSTEHGDDPEATGRAVVASLLGEQGGSTIDGARPVGAP
jgi:hydroxymethylbilane synthase